MLRQLLLAACVVVACASDARAQESHPFTPTGAHRVHLALGFVGGGAAERYTIASSPEKAAILASVGQTLSNRLHVGVDFRWFRGMSPNATASMHYRASRLTVDVGFEFGSRYVRFRPYLGIGANVYRLVLYDYADARFAVVIAEGGLLTFGRDRGLFGGIDLRFAQILHPHSDALAPTHGPNDGSVNAGVVVGWTFTRDVE